MTLGSLNNEVDNETDRHNLATVASEVFDVDTEFTGTLRTHLNLCDDMNNSNFGGSIHNRNVNKGRSRKRFSSFLLKKFHKKEDSIKSTTTYDIYDPKDGSGSGLSGLKRKKSQLYSRNDLHSHRLIIEDYEQGMLPTLHSVEPTESCISENDLSEKLSKRTKSVYSLGTIIALKNFKGKRDSKASYEKSLLALNEDEKSDNNHTLKEQSQQLAKKSLVVRSPDSQVSSLTNHKISNQVMNLIANRNYQSKIGTITSDEPTATQITKIKSRSEDNETVEINTQEALKNSSKNLERKRNQTVRKVFGHLTFMGPNHGRSPDIIEPRSIELIGEEHRFKITEKASDMNINQVIQSNNGSDGTTAQCTEWP